MTYFWEFLIGAGLLFAGWFSYTFWDLCKQATKAAMTLDAIRAGLERTEVSVKEQKREIEEHSKALADHGARIKILERDAA